MKLSAVVAIFLACTLHDVSAASNRKSSSLKPGAFDPIQLEAFLTGKIPEKKPIAPKRSESSTTPKDNPKKKEEPEEDGGMDGFSLFD